MGNVGFLRLTLLAIALGGGFGILYEGNRLVRCLLGMCHYAPIPARIAPLDPFMCRFARRGKSKPLKIFEGIFLAMGDCLFCLATGLAFLLLLYYENEGIFRLFALIGAFFGFWIYEATLGRIVPTGIEWVSFGIRAAVFQGLRFVSLPIRMVCRLVKRGFVIVRDACLEIIEKRKAERYAKRKRKELLAGAARGFLNVGKE